MQTSVSQTKTGAEGTTAASSSTGIAAASSSGGTTEGFGGSTSVGSSTGGAGTTASSSGTTGGGTTSAPPPPIVDGGYVFCSADEGDAGVASWLCHPGTYFCDLTGDAGNCFQCQSDADCANRALPTYDPNRPYCDLTSGVARYQSFCQQCVNNAECAGNPAGPFCDTNPSYPPNWQVPSIETMGFEACGGIPNDCRLGGGPRCGPNQVCDAQTGDCTARGNSCATDADCAGVIANQNLPLSYCVNAECNSCSDPPCIANAPCDGPSCGGLWPVCETDAGNVCGCDTDSECGDAGLVCLKPGTAFSFCALSCASPQAAPCPSATQGCEPDSGLCQLCTDDEQCQAGTQTAGARCGATTGGAGYCGCFFDSDCPTGQICFPGTGFGYCQIPLPRCTPESCNGRSCDWDSGTCLQPFETILPSCITDYDCGNLYESGGDFCLAGSCVACLDDNDCVVAPVSTRSDFTMCCLPGDSSCDSTLPSKINSCVEACHSNADCIGSSDGTTCVLYGDAGYGGCAACSSDADCAGNPNGSYCDLDGGPGWTFICGCLTTADCGPGLACYHAGFDSYCTTYCTGDPDCPAGYFCDPGYACRPRCDNGSQCQGPDPICDTNNAEGQNGETLDGSVPGLIWCYGCLTSNDCLNSQGCNYDLSHACAPCQTDPECASGACFNGTCLATCDAGACPGGQVCDTQGAVGLGRNLCYQCLSPIDCPDGQGCNSKTHTCGSCTGPTYDSSSFYGPIPFDCPPGDFCSNYWEQSGNPWGACLQTCDARACPDDHQICALLPALTPDHKLCFGCLQDSDCADAGPNAWCDTSVDRTFTCQLPVGG